MGHVFIATALGSPPLLPPSGTRNSGSKGEPHPCILTPLSTVPLKILGTGACVALQLGNLIHRDLSSGQELGNHAQPIQQFMTGECPDPCVHLCPGLVTPPSHQHCLPMQQCLCEMSPMDAAALSDSGPALLGLQLLLRQSSCLYAFVRSHPVELQLLAEVALAQVAWLVLVPVKQSLKCLPIMCCPVLFSAHPNDLTVPRHFLLLGK